MASDGINLEWSAAFPVIGKGTFLFSSKERQPFYINVRDVEDIETSIFLSVGDGKASFSTWNESLEDKQEEKIGYEADKTITYWYSYDSDNMTIKYGKGYCMEETTLLKYTFTGDDAKTRHFDPTKPRQVEVYHSDTFAAQPAKTFKFKKRVPMYVIEKPPPNMNEIQDKYMFSPFPFLCNRSPIVRDSKTANMFDIDLGKYTYSTSLPSACQTLYGNVTGVNMSLDYANQKYKLEDAIRHSITTEDCLLWKTLESKKGEFGGDDEIYLRVTLGKSLGNSPGTPYVLEIWPKDCGSPIHNHGSACAVIRVLFGGLNISIYNKHITDETEKPLMTFDVRKDDATWIAPNWYQTHKLWNDTDDFCATIQCYQYCDKDDIHWPYFDFVDTESGSLDNFVPTADFTFTDFYNRVMKEYEEFMESSTK